MSEGEDELSAGPSAKRRKIEPETEKPLKNEVVRISQTSIQDLPDDIILSILAHLDHWSLFQVITCQINRLDRMASDSSLWINVDFGGRPLSLMDNKKIFHRYVTERMKSIKLFGYLRTNTSSSSRSTAPIENLSVSLLEMISNKCPNLEELTLENQLVDARKISVKDFPKCISSLSIVRSEIFNLDTKNSYFKDIHLNLTNLQKLYLNYNNWLNTHSLLALCKIETLEEFSLKGCWRIGECFVYTALATRFGFQNVKKIDLRETSIGDSEVPCFGRLPKVSHVYFGRDTDEPCPQIPDSEGNGRVTDRGIASMIDTDEASEVTHLYLRKTELTDKMLALLATRLPYLKYLDVRGTNITVEGVVNFKLKKSECLIIHDFKDS